MNAAVTQRKLASKVEDREIELDVNPEDVCKLIELARDFHTQEAVVLPNETSDQPLDMSGTAPGDARVHPIRGEFQTIITDLEPRQQVELIALLRLGRGDFTVAEWEGSLRLASDGRGSE